MNEYARNIVNRLQNVGTWVAFAALVPLVLPWFGFNIIPADYKEGVRLVLIFLVTAGVLNNPSSGAGYLDEYDDD